MTLPVILAAVEAQASQPGMVERFGLEPKAIIFRAISFLILFGVLYWFAIKPVLAAMGERAKRIGEGLKDAEEMKGKLEAAAQAYDARLREAQQKAQDIIAEAQKAAKLLADAQQKDAVDRSNAILARAQEAIALEKRQMLAEARDQIARLVVTTTERVLSRELSDADRARYNESATRELTKA